MHERSERVESPGTYVTDEFHEAIFALPCVLSDCPPLRWRLWMPLHDAIRINCKKVTTTENQGTNVKYVG